MAPTGTAVTFEVNIEPDRHHAWSVVRDANAWIVCRGRPAAPAASFRTDGDTAWKLLYNAIPPHAATSGVAIGGDAALVAPMLAARSVMVHASREP